MDFSIKEVHTASLTKNHRYLYDLFEDYAEFSVTRILRGGATICPNKFMLRGSAIHKSLENYLVYGKQPPDDENLDEFVKILANYEILVGDTKRESLKVEKSFVAECDCHYGNNHKKVFIGFTADVFDIENGRVIDFKTGKTRKGYWDQLIMYSLFLNKFYKKDLFTELSLVFNDDVVTYKDISRQQYETTTQKFEKNLEVMVKKKFPDIKNRLFIFPTSQQIPLF